MKIHAWWGDGDRQPIGPIDAELIDLGVEEARIRIVDPTWLEHAGEDEGDVIEYTCSKLPSDYFVRYDDYAWCYIGECDLNTKWW